MASSCAPQSNKQRACNFRVGGIARVNEYEKSRDPSTQLAHGIGAPNSEIRSLLFPKSLRFKNKERGRRGDPRRHAGEGVVDDLDALDREVLVEGADDGGGVTRGQGLAVKPFKQGSVFSRRE